MDLQKFLSLISAGIGLIGALFLAKSFIAQSPNDILHLTSPYSRIAFAPEQIVSMSAQKADAIIGVIFILFAFIGQICALVLVHEATPFVASRWFSFWIAAACVSVLTAIFSFVDLKLSNYIRRETGKVAIRDYCEARFTREKCDPVNLESLKVMGEELLGMNKKPNESNADFIQRIFVLAGLNCPDNPDFLKCMNEMK